MRMLKLGSKSNQATSFLGMLTLMMVLLVYGSNHNRLKVDWEKVDWMVCHSDHKHFHQRLLPIIHQFSELL